ncbi:MAG: hypothetical protein ACOCTH_00380 [Halodesulfurarchaeum sp.]
MVDPSLDTLHRHRTTIAVLTLLALFGLTVAPVVVMLPALADHDSAPGGMVGVSDDAIWTDIPACNNGGGGPPGGGGGDDSGNPMCNVEDELHDHGVLAGDHADTLEVIVTNPGRAKSKYTNGSAVNGAGPAALVFRDDNESTGRDVAVPVSVLEDVLGHEPKVAYGTYEDGSYWKEPITIEDGWAIFYVPHFSDQTVTFEGELAVEANPAVDGDEFTYETHPDAADPTDITLELTGSDATANATASQAALADGEELDFTVDGMESTDLSTEIEVPSGWETSLDTDVRDIERLGNKIYVATGSGSEIATLNKDSGSEGSVSLDGDTLSDNHTAVGTQGDGSLSLYVGDADGTIGKYHPDHGDEYDVKSQEFSGPVEDIHIEGDDMAYAVGGGTLRAYDLVYMDEQWNASTGDGEIAVDSSEDQLYIAGDNVSAFNATDGTSKWTYDDLPGEPTGVAVDTGSGSVIAVDDSGEVHWIDESDGTNERIVSPDDDPPFQTVTVTGGVVLAGTGEGSQSYKTWAFDADSGDTLASDMAYSGSDARKIIPHPDGFVVADDNFDRVSQITFAADIGINLDGEDTGEGAEFLYANETASWTLSDVSTGNHTVSVDLAKSGVDTDLEWTETVHSADPEVTINGNSIPYNGTINDGETVDLSDEVDPSWFTAGEEQSVGVAVSTAYDGPSGEVDLTLSHSGVSNQLVEYDGEEWSERYELNHTFADEQQDATLTIPWASDRVIDLRDLEVTRDGSSVADPDYSFSEGELVVTFGEVDASESVAINATGSKVKVESGDISVTEPTDIGDELETTIRVEETGANGRVEIDVAGTAAGDHLHYVSEGDDDHYIDLTPDKQLVTLQSASNGSNATIKSTDFEVWPRTGDVIATVKDADEPEFQLEPGDTFGDSVEVTYHDTESGHEYELYSVTDENGVDSVVASSPVTLITDDEAATYTINDLGRSTGGGGGGGGGGAGPIAGGDGGQLFGLSSELLLLVFAILALAGLWLLNRSRGGSIPVVRRLPGFGSGSSATRRSSGTSAGRSRFQRALRWLVIGGGLAVAAFLVITTGVAGDLGIPTGELLVVLLGIGALLALWQIDVRTDQSIPRWLFVVAAGLAVLYVLETIEPGVILGGLSKGFETVSPLFWLVLILGGVYFVRKWLQARAQPDTEVRFQLGGERQ